MMVNTINGGTTRSYTIYKLLGAEPLLEAISIDLAVIYSSH